MEGRPELDIAIQQGWKPELLVYCNAYIDEKNLSQIIDMNAAKVLNISKSLFDDLAYQQVPGNFMAVFPSREFGLSDLDPTQPLVILENVEKPGNLGAILRTCDAAGVRQVIVTETAIDHYNPNVLRNSRGAAFTVKTVFCSNDEALNFCTQNQYVTLAAALSPEAIDYRKADPEQKTALIFGAESTGLSDYWFNHSDQQVIIPMRGVVDSLNVSVSVAVMLAHFT